MRNKVSILIQSYRYDWHCEIWRLNYEKYTYNYEYIMLKKGEMLH